MNSVRRHHVEGSGLRRLKLLQPLDLVIGVLVMAFFLVSALVRDGDVVAAGQGALLILVVMFVVSAAIEVIIEALRDLPGLGTVVGFITNGPEALCLLVGLLGNDIIFAASTPLGSNFMNPVMLLAAAIAAGSMGLVFRKHTGYAVTTLGLTAALAASFFFLPAAFRLPWLLVVLVVSVIFFVKRPDDPADQAKDHTGLSRWYAVPAVILLAAAGYWLDPVVSMTAEASHAHKGLIGFFVLAALTSWPEFRSSLTLLRRGRTTSAVLNITVSNITNLWLAIIGVAWYLLAG